MAGQPRHGVLQYRREVDGFPPCGQLPLVGLGQQEELLDELFQTRRLRYGTLGDDRPRRPVRVGQTDVEGRADGGQRGPQLMGGVGHEPALPVRGIVEPGEHVVHGVGQVPDLVGRAGIGHPPAEVGRRDLGDGPPDVFDGAKRPADDEPYGGRGQGQHDRDGEQQASGELGVQLVQEPGRGRGDDSDRPAVDRRSRRYDLRPDGDDFVRRLLAHRLRRSGGQEVDGWHPGECARRRENMPVRVDYLRSGVGVQGRRRERRGGPVPVLARLLDLGDVGPQLPIDRAPRGLGLQDVQQEKPDGHCGCDRDAGHDRHPGAHGAKPWW
jgi:hypothetical protein